MMTSNLRSLASILVAALSLGAVGAVAACNTPPPTTLNIDTTGGSGGSGGSGAPSYTPCSGCKMIPAGDRGQSGPSGNSSSVAGRPGTAEFKRGDVSPDFSKLPPGIRLRNDPRPQAAPTPPPTPPKKGKRPK